MPPPKTPHDPLSASTSQSTLLSFIHGTGHTIHRDILHPAILTATHEVILTTCFWAASETLDDLVATLRRLSDKVTRDIENDGAGASKVKVYICFSSRSATQKLFHTSSRDGFTYPSEMWPGKLGLPLPGELPGLDITVKSLFFRPFSVLHSKYLIVDRRRVYMPSCNVSWEDWYECVVGLEGPVVGHVFEFWREVWMPEGLEDLLDEKEGSDETTLIFSTNNELSLPIRQSLRTTLLPHPHNASLLQSLWLLPSTASPIPSTPLTQTTLHLLAHATHEIIMLTPNFTSHSAYTGLALALLHGVHVHLITNRHMMVPEQLATAGTLTERFVDQLIGKYQTGFSGSRIRRRLVGLGQRMGRGVPDRPAGSAKLVVSYFCQPQQASLISQQGTATTEPSPAIPGYSDSSSASRANKSHIKLTLVDRTTILLGSGNMDRASWRTSQELGVLLEDHRDRADGSESAVENMWKGVERGLEGCLERYFDG